MTNDWRDTVGESLPILGLGDLDPSESVVVMFEGEGSLKAASEEGWNDSVSIHVSLLDAPEGYQAKEEGEDIPVETQEEYYLMSASSRFKRAVAGFADNLTGQAAEITAEGEGFERTYFVESP